MFPARGAVKRHANAQVTLWCWRKSLIGGTLRNLGDTRAVRACMLVTNIRSSVKVRRERDCSRGKTFDAEKNFREPGGFLVDPESKSGKSVKGTPKSCRGPVCLP